MNPQKYILILISFFIQTDVIHASKPAPMANPQPAKIDYTDLAILPKMITQINGARLFMVESPEFLSESQDEEKQKKVTLEQRQEFLYIYQERKVVCKKVAQAMLDFKHPNPTFNNVVNFADQELQERFKIAHEAVMQRHCPHMLANYKKDPQGHAITLKVIIPMLLEQNTRETLNQESTEFGNKHGYHVKQAVIDACQIQ